MERRRCQHKVGHKHPSEGEGAELPSCSAGVSRASPILRQLIYSTLFLPREKHQLLIKLVFLQFSNPKLDELSGRAECC